MFFVIFAIFIFMYIRIVDFNKLNYYIFTLSIVHTYIHTYIHIHATHINTRIALHRSNNM